MSITDGPLAAYRPTLRRRRGLTSRRYTAVLVLGDYLASALGFLLGLLLLNLITRNDFNRLDHLAINVRHGFWFPVGIVVGMAISSQYRLSRRSPTQNSFSELKEYAMATSFGGIIAMGLSYLAHRYGRVEIQVPTQIIVGIVMTSFVVALYRSLLRAAVMSRRPVRVAVIDDGSTYQRIATHLHLQRGIALFGRISLSRDPDPDTIGSIYDIEAIVTEHGLDRVIFGSINELNSEVAYWYRRTTQLVDTALVPRMFEVISWRSRLTDLSGLPLLEMAPRNVSRFDHFMKRTFDVVVALVAWAVLGERPANRTLVAIPIVLGGDHSITWPVASAIAEVRHPRTLGIVHLPGTGRARQPSRPTRITASFNRIGPRSYSCSSSSRLIPYPVTD